VLRAKLGAMTTKERLRKLKRLRRNAGNSANGGRPKRDISAIVGLFDSGKSDVSSNVDKYVGESLWQEHLRETGQSDR
jgi:hypothetical protein